MKNYVNKFALFVALSCGFALAQSMPPQSQQPSSSTPSASQQTPDQTQPSAQPDQSTMPKTDQDQTVPKTDKDHDRDDQKSKMPQSDTAATAGSDVQSQVQTALQQDPKLANANINVTVKGKDLELTGTVPSGKEKKEAAKIAKTNAGNLKVKNHIKVASEKSMQSTPQSGSHEPMDESAPQGSNPTGQSNPPASKPPVL